MMSMDSIRWLFAGGLLLFSVSVASVGCDRDEEVDSSTPFEPLHQEEEPLETTQDSRDANEEDPELLSVDDSGRYVQDDKFSFKAPADWELKPGRDDIVEVTGYGPEIDDIPAMLDIQNHPSLSPLAEYVDYLMEKSKRDARLDFTIRDESSFETDEGRQALIVDAEFADPDDPNNKRNQRFYVMDGEGHARFVVTCIRVDGHPESIVDACDDSVRSFRFLEGDDPTRYVEPGKFSYRTTDGWTVARVPDELSFAEDSEYKQAFGPEHERGTRPVMRVLDAAAHADRERFVEINLADYQREVREVDIHDEFGFETDEGVELVAKDATIFDNYGNAVGARLYFFDGSWERSFIIDCILDPMAQEDIRDECDEMVKTFRLE